MKVLLSAVSLLCATCVFSQTHIEDCFLTGLGVDLHQNEIDSVYRISLNVRISDTLFIDSVVVNVGTISNPTAIFSGSYDLNNDNSLAFPESFEYSQFLISVVIGDMVLSEKYYYSVALKDENGVVFSEIIKQL